MANQGRYNSSFWKNLDKLSTVPYDGVMQIMQKECNYTTEMLDALTPVKFGGLVSSRYAVVAKTANGVSARAGYTQTPHWDLDPAEPHQDKITNPQLAMYLADNSKHDYTKAAMHQIEAILWDFAYNIRIEVNEYLRDYYKNGGI